MDCARAQTWKQTFHSFVGESTAVHWGISQNRHYLQGTHFYWMCDCKEVQEVVEYTVSIVMVHIWAQELLRYNLTVIHRSEKMMGDVDAITRRFGEIFLYTYV